MNEKSCHRPESVGFALGVTSLLMKLRALSRVLRAVFIKMKIVPKMLINVEQGLQATSYKLQADAGKLFQCMRNFKGLLIWQRGMEIVTLVYKVVKYLPKEERFGLQLQMTKSAVSIPSNIAEGSAKRSQKDYLRYVEISLGSAYELETQSLVVQSQGWAPADLIKDLLSQIEQEQRMISKFIDKL